MEGGLAEDLNVDNFYQDVCMDSVGSNFSRESNFDFFLNEGCREDIYSEYFNDCYANNEESLEYQYFDAESVAQFNGIQDTEIGEALSFRDGMSDISSQLQACNPPLLTGNDEFQNNILTEKSNFDDNSEMMDIFGCAGKNILHCTIDGFDNNALDLIEPTFRGFESSSVDEYLNIFEEDCIDDFEECSSGSVSTASGAFCQDFSTQYMYSTGEFSGDINATCSNFDEFDLFGTHYTTNYMDTTEEESSSVESFSHSTLPVDIMAPSHVVLPTLQNEIDLGFDKNSQTLGPGQIIESAQSDLNGFVLSEAASSDNIPCNKKFVNSKPSACQNSHRFILPKVENHSIQSSNTSQVQHIVMPTNTVKGVPQFSVLNISDNRTSSQSRLSQYSTETVEESGVNNSCAQKSSQGNNFVTFSWGGKDYTFSISDPSDANVIKPNSTGVCAQNVNNVQQCNTSRSSSVHNQDAVENVLPLPSTKYPSNVPKADSKEPSKCECPRILLGVKNNFVSVRVRDMLYKNVKEVMGCFKEPEHKDINEATREWKKHYHLLRERKIKRLNLEKDLAVQSIV